MSQRSSPRQKMEQHDHSPGHTMSSPHMSSPDNSRPIVNWAKRTTAMSTIDTLPRESESPRTPYMLVLADKLRSDIADLIISCIEGECQEPQSVIENLAKEYDDEVIWEAALRCSYTEGRVHQDIPLVEAASKGQIKLVDALISSLKLSPRQRSLLLEAPGKYGRTALAHAVRLGKWQMANHLIRAGASIGHAGDDLCIISGILRAAQKERTKSGSWRLINRDLSRCFSTITSLYGQDWATVTTTPKTILNDEFIEPNSIFQEPKILPHSQTAPSRIGSAPHFEAGRASVERMSTSFGRQSMGRGSMSLEKQFRGGSLASLREYDHDVAPQHF